MVRRRHSWGWGHPITLAASLGTLGLRPALKRGENTAATPTCPLNHQASYWTPGFGLRAVAREEDRAGLGLRVLGPRLSPPHSGCVTLGKPLPSLVLMLIYKERLDSILAKGSPVDTELGPASSRQ